jgi:hypothetical protein
MNSPASPGSPPPVAPARWQRYSRGFDTHRPQIHPTAPAAHSQRLGNYQLTEVGSARVLCVKSELHLNQDEPSRR